MRMLILGLVVLAGATCQSMPREQTSMESEMVEAGDTTAIRGVGTIVFNDFEGGFYGIVADGGQRYYAGTLEEDYRVDGLRVRFVLRPLRGVMSTVMWGQSTQVVTLQKLDQQ